MHYIRPNQHEHEHTHTRERERERERERGRGKESYWKLECLASEEKQKECRKREEKKKESRRGTHLVNVAENKLNESNCCKFIGRLSKLFTTDATG